MFADEAGSVYERAVTTLMKNNMLVYFAYADFEEVLHVYSFGDKIMIMSSPWLNSFFMFN